MSASLVRKALELSSDKSAEKLHSQKQKSISKKDIKITKKKKVTKKRAAEKQLKQNLLILKALGTPISSKSSKKKKGNTSIEAATSSTKFVFTEEDFKKFESEYFVTE